MSLTHVYMIGHFPGTGTSIKSDGVKLVDLKGMYVVY